jgi:surface polysaccharide O-acyltransferase-like enzyme
VKGIAIFAVIILHSVQPQNGPEMGWALQILNQVCRFAVPCFFLMAGFFFMHAWRRNSDHLALARSYGGRLMKPFIFWALFYAVIPPFIGGSPHGIGPAILGHLANIARYPHSFLLTGFVYHLWFLSSMLQAAGIVWVSLRLGDLRIALALGFVLYCVALLGGSYSQTAFGFHTHFDMKNGPFVSTLFFALGAWIEERRPNIPLLAGALLLWIGLIAHLVEGVFLLDKFARPIINNQYLLGTPLYAVGVMFVALARPNFAWGVATAIGVYSLGVYAFHPYVIEVLLRLPFGHVFSSEPLLLSLLVLAIAFATMSLLGRIRWLRPFVV